MNQIKTIFLSAFLIFTQISFTQTKSIDNVLDFKIVKSIGEITENNQIIGYYIYYLKEKVDKKNSFCQIEIYDNDFNLKQNFDITLENNTKILQSSFNGNSFLFYFYHEDLSTSYVCFNKNGNENAKILKTRKEMNAYEFQKISLNAIGSLPYFFLPNGKDGYLIPEVSKNNKQNTALVFYDNNLKKIWTYEPKYIEKTKSSCNIVEITNDNILCLITTSGKGIKGENHQLLVLDRKTGKYVTELELGNTSEEFSSILKIKFDDSKKQFIATGEYYENGISILNTKSTGIYALTFDLNGKTINKSKFAWKGDIDKFKQANSNPEFKDNFNLYFHDIIISDKGNITLIAEQFKKQASAGGMLMNATVGSNVSNIEVVIGNIVLLEINNEFKISNYEEVNKKTHKDFLLRGTGTLPIMFIGNYLKSNGYYDYIFLSKSEDEYKYSIVYTDRNVKNEKADYVIGVINLENGKTNVNKIPLNTKANEVTFMKSKPGYLLVSEYFKKEKKIKLRMEQVAY